MPNNAKQDDIRETAENVAEGLRDKVKAGTAQMRDAIDEGIDQARARGAEALHAARETADEMRDEAARLYHKGERRVNEMAGDAAAGAELYYDEVSEMVRRQPATALGIAAGIGFLAGLLIARR